MPPTPSKMICSVCNSDFYPSDKLQIRKNKLLLAEGTDVHRFLIYACPKYRSSDDVQVMNFRGKDELRSYLDNLVDMSKFAEVTTLVIARDADTHVGIAIESVTSALGDRGLPSPTSPFEWASNQKIKTAFILFPGPDQNGQCQMGTIEDLCLSTVSDDPLLRECVEPFLKCAQSNQENGKSLMHLEKSRLHAFLAAKEDHACKLLGQAAEAGVWKWDHPTMEPFKLILQAM